MDLSLRNAFKFYRDLEHQNQAIDRLEQWLKENNPEQLEKFQHLWRSVSIPEVTREFALTHKQNNQEPTIQVPGISHNIYLHEPIIPGGNFTWADATHNGSRVLHNKETVDSIIAFTEQLQAARDQIGRPFIITNWYHPHAAGEVVGQRKKTEHQQVEAVDFRVDGYTGPQLADELSWWQGGLATYSYVPYLVHLDNGPHHRWQAAYPR